MMLHDLRRLVTARWWPLLYWSALLMLALFLKWGHLVNQDEGLTLAGAWQVSQGLQPYRDFYDFITPGSYYFLAVVFKIFGPTYVVAKIFSLFLLLTSLYGVQRIAVQFSLGLWSWWPPLLWLLLSDHYVLINHNTYALVAAIWTIERALAAAGKTAVRWPSWLVVGLFAGATVMLHQARGAAVVAAVPWLALTFGVVPALAVIGGVALALLPLLAWPLPLLLQSLVVFPFAQYLPFNQTGMALLAALLGVYLGVALLSPSHWRDRRWVFLWGCGVLLLASNFSQADRFHLLPAVFPIGVLIATVAARQHSRWPALMAASGTAVLAVISIGFTAHRIASVGVRPFLQLRDPQLEQLVSRVQQTVAPEQPIFAAPFLPNLYFETQRRNPTRFNVLIYRHHPPAFFAEARASLEADPPPIILLNYYTTPEKFATFLPGNPVTDYIRQHYRYAETVNNIQVYRRVLAPVP
ncbi:MAG: hypothetical protein Q7S23_02245 [bacterium]|nr:hypothetical protein [bacterium]